jgi:hypothetical protein
MGIKFTATVKAAGPAGAALAEEPRAVMGRSRFNNLTDLGRSLRSKRDKQRLSELTVGTRLPDEAELRAVADACDRSAWPHLAELLRRTCTERTATTDLPVVGEFADWWRLGVHRPVTELDDVLGQATGRRCHRPAEEADADSAAQLYAALDDDVALACLAESGNSYANGQLASLLAERGDLKGLERLANADDDKPAEKLAELRAARGLPSDRSVPRRPAGDRPSSVHGEGVVVDLV